MITKASIPTHEQWDSIWQSCDWATFYHSRQWHNVWQKYTQGQITPCPVLIEFDDQKKALLPLCMHSILKGAIKRYLSSPATSYGGWISNDMLTSDHNDLIARYIYEHFPKIILRLNPLLQYNPTKFSKYLKNDYTQILSLDNNFDTIFHSWTKGHRSATTKAQKIGVTVRLAREKSDWDNFYRIYLDSFKRWGSKATSRYRSEFFEAIHSLQSPNVKLWLADYKGRSIAGAVIFYAKRHVTYGYSAALGEFFNLRAMNVLLYEIIKDACEKKYMHFDLSPSGGHDGVISFKKSFGSKKIFCPIIKRQPVWLDLMVNVYKLFYLRK